MLSDFGVGDAGEIALGEEEVLHFRPIETCGIDRSREIGYEHAVARNVKREPDPFHQMGQHDLRIGPGVTSIDARFTVLPRGGSPRSVQ